MWVGITGTREGPDGSYSHVSAKSETYEEAKAALEGMVPKGHKVIVIRRF